MGGLLVSEHKKYPPMGGRVRSRGARKNEERPDACVLPHEHCVAVVPGIEKGADHECRP